MNKIIKSLLLTTSLLMVNPTVSYSSSSLDMDYEKPYFKSTQLSSLENIIVNLDSMPLELEEQVVPYILNSRKIIAAEVVKYFEDNNIVWGDFDFSIPDFVMRSGGIDRVREEAIGKVIAFMPKIDPKKEYKYKGGTARQFVFTGNGAIIPGFQENN